jgi:hypothetical protein
MWEGLGGGRRRAAQRKIPQDSQVYSKGGDWCVRVSSEAQCVIFETLDYHPGLLYLSKEDLERMLAKLRAA